jgi:hypothetical protein
MVPLSTGAAGPHLHKSGGGRRGQDEPVRAERSELRSSRLDADGRRSYCRRATDSNTLGIGLIEKGAVGAAGRNHVDRDLAAMAKLNFYFETMAGTHLADAVRALRDSGSADALYDASVRAMPPSDVDEDVFSISRDIAQSHRVSYSRRALLFAAFAAEAYANDFLHERWDGQDREALERLSPINKYVLLSQLAGRPPLTRDAEPIQTLKWLFQRRDELVHATPRGPDLTYHPANHNPQAAAKCIVAVADAAERLAGEVHPKSVLAYVLEERQGLLGYGVRAENDLPRIWDAASADDLLEAPRRRAWATA